MAGIIYSQIRLMWTVFAAIAAVLAILFLAQRTFIYFPAGQVGSPSAAGLDWSQTVRFQTEDGLDLEAWFVAAREPSDDRTIVVFPGNAGNRSHRAPLAATFAEYGWSTLLVDYRGYGGNPGLPSETGLARDARAVATILPSLPGVNPARVVYFGESLGAAVAIRLAQEHPPAALILRSPFSSMSSVGSHHYPFLPVRWLLRDRYSSIDVIGGLSLPTLFIAGDRDSVVPLAETEALFEEANNPKRLVVIPGADHNDEALLTGVEMMAAIRMFLSAA
jgi:fermentation-respiration switch protein FrsA (DUF1100 family)